MRAIYRHHPLFAGADFLTYYGGDDASHLPASIEGGDVHVLGHGAVLIGMGERTTPMAAEILAGALISSGQARTVIAVELPQSHAMMHLDTVMTMVDTGVFVLYPYFDRHLRSWTVTAGGGKPGLQVPRNRSLWDTLSEILDTEVSVLATARHCRAEKQLGMPQHRLAGACLLTRTVLKADDPAFGHPAKFVGSIYSEATARTLAGGRGWEVSQDGTAWRRGRRPAVWRPSWTRT